MPATFPAGARTRRLGRYVMEPAVVRLAAGER